MKVVILAGGLGTRIMEESAVKPKPMIEIGGMPILWHIMKSFSTFGFKHFIICLGYKGHVIKDYFARYYLHHSDVTFNYNGRNDYIAHHSAVEPWTVTLVDTGQHSMTGGRVKRVADYVGNDPFILTYGDAVSDIDLNLLLTFHLSHGRLATVSAVQPSGRFGALSLDSNKKVVSFKEKPKGDGQWSSAGFFVMHPDVMDYIKGDQTILEKEPLENLAKDGQLMAYKHTGFWHPMDTMKDKNELEHLWNTHQAPWKRW
ncbi:glucose-1-phosphate cytidylyltransferase [Paenibacillus beijingensis]|uniref:Glucose-1-phosphate cytidylyltransferase n=1 Tax=Paenibacillus beijingensis TaxID=1126833 RepID=A0A0D5NQR7_9BACL|nr:glucose-1-phosphate cytidylyltransferase [Paenibacillus beijingensis]AJY77540.1 glucose-1-phosphate cytidylyltransferase [Paenibacillus beijingensis]